MTLYSDNFDVGSDGDPLDNRELDQPNDVFWSDVYPAGGPSAIALNQDRAKCVQLGAVDDQAGFAYITTDATEENPCLSVAADLYVVDTASGDPEVDVRPRVAYVFIGPADAVSASIYAGFISNFDEEDERDALLLRYEPANITIREPIGPLNSVPNGSRVMLTNDGATLRVYYNNEPTPRITYTLPLPLFTTTAGIFSQDVARDSAWDNFEATTGEDCPDPPPGGGGGSGLLGFGYIMGG